MPLNKETKPNQTISFLNMKKYSKQLKKYSTSLRIEERLVT